MDLKNKVLEIQQLINLNKISKALLKCEKLIKKFPNNSFIFNLYGLIMQKDGQLLRSVVQFNKALSYDPNNFAAMNNLANSQKNLYNFKDAEYLFRKIIKEDPNNIKALNNYANLKKEINKYKDAKSLLLMALEIDPNNIDIISNIAACCHGIGELEEAKNYALKIASLQPYNTTNHRFLSSIINYSKEKDHLETLEKLLSIENFKNFLPSEKIDLYFALGKAYEDVKNFKNSHKFLAKANYIMKQNSNYDISKTAKLFDNIIKLFNDSEILNFKKKQSTKKIIFICGMPRSGTTLVEQIVASHSKVSGAGELQYLSNIIKDNFLENLKFNKQKIIEELSNDENIILEKFLQLLNFHDFDTDIITDKAPQNFIWIGFIKLFFPNCKIIHCSRNPKDNCLSLYKNYFSSSTMSWAYDQIEIGKYYNLYRNIMIFWKSKFNDFIFDASYENLVNSPEVEVKKMLSFCNLNWEADCLNFYNNKKTPVQTVSVSQASKPIYKSSVNSSEAYAEYLSDMFHILDSKI